MRIPRNPIVFDTEFYEDGAYIHPLAIGLVKPGTDETLYLEWPIPWAVIPNDAWVLANVIPHMTHEPTPLLKIRREILKFVGYQPTLITWFGQYDMVMFQQIWGAFDQYAAPQASHGLPFHTVDLKPLVDLFAPDLEPPRTGIAHNALHDALNIATLWEAFVERMTRPQNTRAADERRPFDTLPDNYEVG
jgi:hypothetical protein